MYKYLSLILLAAGVVYGGETHAANKKTVVGHTNVVGHVALPHVNDHPVLHGGSIHPKEVHKPSFHARHPEAGVRIDYTTCPSVYRHPPC